jgi:arsenate reductase-like glutaredoxin family protein
MDDIQTIKLFGADGCHKTNYYKVLLDKTELPYQFLDVEKNKEDAEELRNH